MRDVRKALTCSLAMVFAIVLMSGGVNAATVKPSGKYVFTNIDSCEAKFTFTFASYRTAAGTTDNAVRTINSVANGHIGSAVGTIVFTPTGPAGGTFVINMTEVGGGALRINSGGVNVVPTSQSMDGTYTFTASTITLTNGTETSTFTMAYGQLPASGIPNSVHLVRKHASGDTPNCVESIIATK
jgi:hypothetical protein